MDPELLERLVVAFERIADVLEGTTDDEGLIHLFLRTPADEGEDKE